MAQDGPRWPKDGPKRPPLRPSWGPVGGPSWGRGAFENVRFVKAKCFFLLSEAVLEKRRSQQKQKSHEKRQKMAKKWPQQAQEAVLECATPIDGRFGEQVSADLAPGSASRTRFSSLKTTTTHPPMPVLTRPGPKGPANLHLTPQRKYSSIF